MATPALRRLTGARPPLDQIAHGLRFSEGPVWDARNRQFFYTDIVNDTIWKWQPGIGSSVVMCPTGKANGMTFDHDGRLLVAGWGSRRVWRIEHDGNCKTLCSHYKGQKLNSPNDIVVTAAGSIYFTDSFGGLCNPEMGCEDVQRYLDFAGVFRIDAKTGATTLVVPDMTYPNGLAFSPDEKRLYVNDSRDHLINVYDVRENGSLSGARLFCRMTGAEQGIADGMKVDCEGNVYCTGPGGIHVISPQGKLLGRLRIPDHTTNLAWGDDDWCSLYITTYLGVYRTRLKTPGVPVGAGAA